MKIELNRLNDGFHMEARNEYGNSVQMDASAEIGGTDQGMRPMQLLLAALGGCSSIDIINILKKQKQPLKDIKVTITGEREKDVNPSLFVEAHVHFKFFGELDEDKVQKAVVLGVDKYCSVGKTLAYKAKITHSFEIVR
ncbi:MAG: OsmC family protein [Chryseolinea sp.]